MLYVLIPPFCVLLVIAPSSVTHRSVVLGTGDYDGSADVIRPVQRSLVMIKTRKDRNIKFDRRRQLKHLLISGNTPVTRKDTHSLQVSATPIDYSKLGWKVFVNWNKHRYVLPSEIKEYNVSNLHQRSTLGIRTAAGDRRPLGGDTQVELC